ncbi:unnamed protein product [Prorocentrum cordatum]|uniref:Secreted protein n=1 Tax=Prorocentrum cordatum TaxID=2364126 RepID=A0ABN9TQN2_9DINO|nr:unnamed protein product [Polarella glacialis]
MWWTSLWVCPAVAVVVHLYWLSATVNATGEGFPAMEPSSLLAEQALFVQRLWHLLWTGRLALEQLASAELRAAVLLLLGALSARAL